MDSLRKTGNIVMTDLQFKFQVGEFHITKRSCNVTLEPPITPVINTKLVAKQTGVLILSSQLQLYAPLNFQFVVYQILANSKIFWIAQAVLDNALAD